MKKFVFGSLAFIGFIFGVIFAQDNNILPDEAEIGVKDIIIQGEATNLSVTMMKNGSKMSNYVGTIYFTIEDENGNILKTNEYTLLDNGFYKFLPEDLGSKEFQKGLEIKKEGKFFITVTDMDDPDEKILGKQPITVIKDTGKVQGKHIDIYSPIPEGTVTNDKVDIFASVPELQNSQALIYIDNNPPETTTTDSDGFINYSIGNIGIGKHSLTIEVPDNIDGTILGVSDKIYFTVIESDNPGIKEIEVNPEQGLMIGEKTTITVYTDEMVESIKMKLSDRPSNDDIILTKNGAGEFSYSFFLISTGEIDISLETFSANNTISQSYENIKQIFVADTPEISNVTVETDETEQTATVSWDIVNGEPISSYIINYQSSERSDLSGEVQTENQTYQFLDVPYNTTINLTITPIRQNSLKLPTHGAASKTIQFIITKPGSEEGTSSTTTGTSIKLPRCTVQNINTHTEKIGNNYYLIWDKVENVSKYIVYSSTSPEGYNKVKVYETNDTNYEYPFDYNAKEDQFMYFRIVGICDDGEELELTGATKVQVGPAENFFLLLCLTLLIYSGIKLFRQTEE